MDEWNKRSMDMIHKDMIETLKWKLDRVTDGERERGREGRDGGEVVN